MKPYLRDYQRYVRPAARLAAGGKTIAAIAAELGLARKTVRNYLTKARLMGLLPYHKFDIDLVVEVMWEVLRRGPLPPAGLYREVVDTWGTMNQRQFYRALALAKKLRIVIRIGGPRGSCHSRYLCSSKAPVSRLTSARKKHRDRLRHA